MTITSPMCTGNGAFIVHKNLERNLPGYRVVAYNPYWTMTPFILPLFSGPKASVVHTTPDHAICFATRRARLLLTFHNYVLDGPMRPYSSLMQQIHYRTDLRVLTHLALRRADRVTAVSEATAELVRRDLGYKGPILVIPNGIDAVRFHPKENKPSPPQLRVLFSGNPTRRKGAHWLPAIADRVSPKVSIHITGGLRYGSRALKHPRLIPLDRVSFGGMPDLYQSMDVLLLPTIREGMSLAVLEAMATGLPVVASNTSSLPELVHHGKGGFLCPVGDTEAFASALNVLAEDPALRRRMGDYNRVRIESEFKESQMVEAYRSLFRTLLA